MTNIPFILALAAFLLVGCVSLATDRRCPDSKADPLVEAKRLVALDKAGLKINCTHPEGHHITLPDYNGNGMFTEAAGVMIEDAIYYEALGVGSSYSAKMRQLAHETKGSMAGEQFSRNAVASERLREK